MVKITSLGSNLSPFLLEQPVFDGCVASHSHWSMEHMFSYK